MARRKADVKRTLLCATRFWSLGWKARDNSTPTLRAGVRHVVRKQGFTPAEIDKAERELVREGKLEVAGVRSGKTLRLTDKGNRADCKLVKLAPWTDSQYPGAALTGPRKPRRLLQAKDLKPGVRFKYRGAEVEVLKPKEKTKDRFGREMDSWWCRRSDTGTEGYVILGPGGVIHAEP